jgi:hypothetical protein
MRSAGAFKAALLVSHEGMGRTSQPTCKPKGLQFCYGLPGRHQPCLWRAIKAGLLPAISPFGYFTTLEPSFLLNRSSY